MGDDTTSGNVRTLSPTATGRDWRHGAACRGEDPELFFPVAESGTARSTHVSEAKVVCGRCPVVVQCREWAVETLPFGVAGGLDEDERHAVRARQTGRRRTGVVARPIGGRRREVAAAGRAAVASGESVRSVAQRFEVSERTVYHWRAAGRAKTRQLPGRVR